MLYGAMKAGFGLRSVLSPTGLANPLFLFDLGLFAALLHQVAGSWRSGFDGLLELVLNRAGSGSIGGPVGLNTQDAVLERHNNAVAESEAHGLADQSWKDNAAVLVDASFNAKYFH